MTDRNRRYEVNRIVVGFNGSDESCDATALARVLADPEANVIVASVGNVPPLGRAADELRGRRFETRNAVGLSAAAGLRRLAEEEGAELIVIGSPHRGRLGRALLGSVGIKLTTISPCAVAVAPRGYAHTSHGSVGVIGVGYDGSRESRFALIQAEKIALRTGSDLRLIDVVRVPPGKDILPDHVNALRAQAEERLGEARRAIIGNLGELTDELAVETAVIDGDPPDVLAMEGVEIDLLVLGSRGNGPLRSAALGSVSAAVIATCPCPVVVVPRAAASKELSPRPVH